MTLWNGGIPVALGGVQDQFSIGSLWKGCLPGWAEGLGLDTSVADHSQLGSNTHPINLTHVFLCSLLLSQIADVQAVLLCWQCYAKSNPKFTPDAAGRRHMTLHTQPQFPTGSASATEHLRPGASVYWGKSVGTIAHSVQPVWADCF